MVRRKLRIQLGLAIIAGAAALSLTAAFDLRPALAESVSPAELSVEAPPGGDPQASPAPVEPTAPPVEPSAEPASTPRLPSANADQSGISLMVRAPQPRSFEQIQSEIEAAAAADGVRISVSLTELAGYNPQSWNFDGGQQIVAASTYKLPLLMAEAQLIASGQAGAGDLLCYDPEDYEGGWFDDYSAGACFTRADLAFRAAHYSDNTAAHILVRYLGGAGALNAFASALGASHSAFFDPNVTTTDDLARLMVSEAQGRAGGTAAQGWLFPLLTQTAFEAGIPVGTPGANVVHKIGEVDGIVNDVALVSGGPNGAYVLAVSVDGLSADGGFALIAQISSKVWEFEAGRSKQ